MVHFLLTFYLNNLLNLTEQDLYLKNPVIHFPNIPAVVYSAQH